MEEVEVVNGGTTSTEEGGEEMEEAWYIYRLENWPWTERSKLAVRTPL